MRNKKIFSKFAFSAKKIGGTFYSDFQNFQLSHPVVVGQRKSGFQKCPIPPPPVEVLVIFLYYCLAKGLIGLATDHTQNCWFYPEVTVNPSRFASSFLCLSVLDNSFIALLALANGSHHTQETKMWKAART